MENVSYAKNPQSANFKDWALVGDCDDEEITADQCSNSSSELVFDIYYPKNTAYTHYSTCPLPVIFMFHPGGFSDCSSKENTTGIQTMCIEFAARGFVVFNVEYRRGKLLYPDDDIEIVNQTKTIYQQVAVYRAGQDARGALRSALKMQADGVFGAAFTFDVNKVFGAGASAGAGAILTVAYLQKQSMIDAVSPGFKDRLGNIDADYYYAPPTSTLPELKAVLCMWGNFPMQGSVKTQTQATNFFNQNNYTVPLIAFQGIDDGIVKYDWRYERFPPSTPPSGSTRGNYDTTSFCLENGGLISVTPSGTNEDLLMIGPLTLRDLVRNNNKPAEVYLDCDMGHGLADDCCTGNPTKKGKTCSDNCPPVYLTEFGTGRNNSTAVQRYMVERAAVFFQSIITGTTINGPSLFVECENFRNSCQSSSTNHDGCQDTDSCN